MDDRTRTLVDRAQAADGEAVDELFRRYRDPLRRGLRKMLGERYRLDVADSEDAAHDAILSAIGELSQFEYRGEGSFLGWLLKRAEFALRNRLRQRAAAKRRPSGGVADLGDEHDPVADQRSVAGQAHAASIMERVRACLDELPERERDIVLMRRFMDLDMAEIVRELDLPSQSAGRNLLSRAQARLMGVLARHGLKPTDL